MIVWGLPMIGGIATELAGIGSQVQQLLRSIVGLTNRIVLGLKVSYKPMVIDGVAVCNLSQLGRMGLKFCRMASHRHQLWCNFDAIKLD